MLARIQELRSLPSSLDCRVSLATTGSMLIDSVADGVTNRAVTPNAVYDVSGDLQTKIDAAGGGGVPGATGVLIDANTANISTLTTNVAATGAKVTAELVGVSGSVSTNASNISTNTSNISTLTTNVAATGAKVTAELVGVSGSVSTNASNISTLTTNLAATGAKVTAELVGLSGVVSTTGSMLIDSVADGVTNRAVTPNAVYDVSGDLQTKIDAGGGTAYTAGTGLTLVGTQFNTAGLGNFRSTYI